MELFEVQRIYLLTQGHIRGIATMVIAGCFIVYGIKIIKKRDGTLFVAMPATQDKGGTFRDVVHPLDLETKELIERLVLERYKAELEKPQTPTV